MDGTRRAAFRWARWWALGAVVAMAVWGDKPLPGWFAWPWAVVGLGAVSCALSWRWLRRVNRRIDRALAEPLAEHVPGLPGQMCPGTCAVGMAHQAPQVVKLGGAPATSPPMVSLPPNASESVVLAAALACANGHHSAACTPRHGCCGGMVDRGHTTTCAVGGLAPARRHAVALVQSPSGAALFTARHADGSPCSAECQARWQS